MTYDFPRSPLRHPRGAPKYLISYRCLEAPQPCFIDGFYAMDPRRRMRPGLLPVPQGFAGTLDKTEMANILRALIERTCNNNAAVESILELSR